MNQAEKNIQLGNIEQAIAWLNTAYARTIGHKKSDRIEAWKNKLCRENNIIDNHRYAEDNEAI